MRVDFVSSMERIFAADERAIFITGDLGYNALENLRTTYSRRFINAGVAEQNMMGMAAGLALAGYHPWVYSIAPFAVYRCFEQIRNDICLHNLPVRIVGNGGGYTYGIMGSTHHALEDLGALKTLPNMQLFFPCTNDHVAAAVAVVHGLAGPAYLRLAISGFARQQAPVGEDAVTLTRQYLSGSQLTVVGVGHAIQPILTALAGGPASGTSWSGVVDLFGLARFPLDLQRDTALVQSVQRTGRLLLVDEHYASGSIAESLVCRLPAVGRRHLMSAQYTPAQTYGSPAFQLRQSQLAPEDIMMQMTALLEGPA